MCKFKKKVYSLIAVNGVLYMRSLALTVVMSNHPVLIIFGWLDVFVLPRGMLKRLITFVVWPISPFKSINFSLYVMR